MTSIREMYEKYGVQEYYKHHSDDYENPHADDVRSLLSMLDCSDIHTGIDFACGTGLVSSHLENIVWYGIDPYMSQKYAQITGNMSITGSMEQVSNGEVYVPIVDVIVCSYCFDIFEKSYMNKFLWRLSEWAQQLVVIRSNKKVVDSICWELVDTKIMGKSHMTIYNRIRDFRP